MLKISINDVVNTIVTSQLVRQGRNNEALYMAFDISIRHYNKNKSYERRQGLHLVYHCEQSSTYVSVFSATSQNPYDKLKDIDSWKLESHHDSAWRNISVFSQVYFSMTSEINADLVNDGMNEVRPCDMNESNSFVGACRDKLFTWIPVNVVNGVDSFGPERKKLILL
jgi:hypothetical protein